MVVLVAVMVISNAQDVDGTVSVDTQHDGNQDRFGIEQLFASVDESGDWYANWDGRRVVDKAFQVRSLMIDCNTVGRLTRTNGFRKTQRIRDASPVARDLSRLATANSS